MNSMKRIIYWAALILPLLAGCTKPSSYPDAPAPEQYDRYIFFSHGVETKADLIESAAGLDGNAFGVVGFKYDFYDKDGNEVLWNDHKNTNPTPNVFYDEVVNSDGTSTYDITPVETVWVTAGAQGTTAEYAPLQGWSNNKKYTFFAFYPHMPLVNLDGSTPYDGGVPAIKYTNPSLEKSKMVDVMTSPAYIDKFWKSSAEGGNNITSGEVKFAFQHRLSALEVKVMNSSDGDITVTSVTLEVNGLKYSDMTMPLDYTEKVTSSQTSVETPLSGTFTLSLGDAGQTFETSPKPEYGSLSDKLIFIPQSENVTINVTIEYTRSYDGYSAVEGSKTIEGLTTALVEGQKHLIKLKFTDSTVEVNGKVSEEGWVEIPDVNSSFK